MEKGAKFQHYKGGIYTFHGLGRHSETLETMVVYSNEEKEVWLRPASSFFGMVEKAGRSFPRFRSMSDSEKKDAEYRKVEVFSNGKWEEVAFTALQESDVVRFDSVEPCYVVVSEPYLEDGYWHIRYVQVFKFDDGNTHWIVARDQQEAEKYFVHDYIGEKDYTANSLTVKCLTAEELTENLSSQEGQHNSWSKMAVESHSIPNCIADDSGYGDPL